MQNPLFGMDFAAILTLLSALHAPLYTAACKAPTIAPGQIPRIRPTKRFTFANIYGSDCSLF
jgi:hypothetical protein